MDSTITKKRDEKDFNYPLAVFVFIGVTVLVTILSLTLNDTSFEFSNQVAIESDIPAPDFSFPRLDGKKVSLSDHKGKVVLVNIWATWCPPCVDEMPSMEKLYRKFKEQDFVILAVSIDESGRKAVALSNRPIGLRRYPKASSSTNRAFSSKKLSGP